MQSMRYWTGQFAHHEKERARIQLRIKNATSLDEETDARNELKEVDMAWEDLLTTRENDFQNEKQATEDQEDDFIVGDNDYERLQEKTSTVSETEKALAMADEIARKKEQAQKRLEEKKKSMAAQYDEFGDDSFFSEIDLSAYTSPKKARTNENTVETSCDNVEQEKVPEEPIENIEPSASSIVPEENQGVPDDSVPATVPLSMEVFEASQETGKETNCPTTVALVATQPVLSSDEETFEAIIPLETEGQKP